MTTAKTETRVSSFQSSRAYCPFMIGLDLIDLKGMRRIFVEKDIIDGAMHLGRSPVAAGMPGFLGPG